MFSNVPVVVSKYTNILSHKKSLFIKFELLFAYENTYSIVKWDFFCNEIIFLSDFEKQ